jgi:hypothetical protein
VGTRNPDSPDPSAPRRRKAPPLSTGCKARVGRGPLRRGTATLAPEELRFHTGRTGREGEDFSVHVRHEDITTIEADGPAGILTVSTREQGTLVFYLGRLAVAWKEILDERPDLLRELEVTPGTRVVLVGVQDDRLEALLGARPEVPEPEIVDVLFAGAEHPADLARLATLAARVRRGGGLIWVVYPEGSRAITAVEIEASARALGLVSGVTVELSPGRLALRLSRP